MANIHFILGGARSGKSRLAEQTAMTLAQQESKSLVYIATAEQRDGEMSERIALHQAQRSQSWQTLECSIELVAQLKELKMQRAVVLVDCLTLWLSNYLCQFDVNQWRQAKAELITLLADWQTANAEVIFVSNEVGHGIVPLGELSRQFVDESGWLHQALAQVSTQVDFVMAGLPLTLKKTEEIQ